MRGGAYKKGDIVWYLGKLYRCLNDNNPALDPTVSTFYWEPYQCPDGGIVDAGMEAAPPDPGPLSGGGKGCMDADPVHSGTSTYYELLMPGVPSKSGTCSYDLTQIPEPPCWVAMNQTRFAASKDCGACVKITGPGGSIHARVVDLCPANSTHCNEMEHIDINTRPGCFYAIGGTDQAGVANITWNYEPCTVTGNVQILAQSSSITCNSRLTITNHRYRIAKVELLLGDGTYKSLTRNPDDVFVIDSVISPACQALGPFRIRITDMYGHWVENRVMLTAGKTTDIGLQFPACPGGS